MSIDIISTCLITPWKVLKNDMTAYRRWVSWVNYLFYRSWPCACFYFFKGRWNLHFFMREKHLIHEWWVCRSMSTNPLHLSKPLRVDFFSIYIHCGIITQHLTRGKMGKKRLGISRYTSYNMLNHWTNYHCGYSHKVAHCLIHIVNINKHDFFDSNRLFVW